MNILIDVIQQNSCLSTYQQVALCTNQEDETGVRLIFTHGLLQPLTREEKQTKNQSHLQRAFFGRSGVAGLVRANVQYQLLKNVLANYWDFLVIQSDYPAIDFTTLKAKKLCSERKGEW